MRFSYLFILHLRSWPYGLRLSDSNSKPGLFALTSYFGYWLSDFLFQYLYPSAFLLEPIFLKV